MREPSQCGLSGSCVGGKAGIRARYALATASAAVAWGDLQPVFRALLLELLQPLDPVSFQGQQSHQLVRPHHANHVKADEFHLALTRPSSCEHLQHQGSDQRTVNLDRHSRERLCEQVAAPEDALQPFEKEFHLPTITVNKSDEFSLNIKIGVPPPNHRTGDVLGIVLGYLFLLCKGFLQLSIDVS